MSSEDKNQTRDPDLLDTSHPAVSGRFRKSSTRPKKKPADARGALSNLFTPPPMNPSHELAPPPTVSSYSIAHHGEQLVLEPPQKPTSTVSGPSEPSQSAASPAEDATGDNSGKKDVSTGRQAGDVPDGRDAPSAAGREYSNEARAYHTRYAELSRAHDEGRYDECRNGSLHILTEPRLPYWTRVQTLQMVSTLLRPSGAEECLRQADAVIDLLDPNDFRTELLRGDNRKMKADIDNWRAKRGLRGKDIAGEGNKEQSEPVAEYFDLDRHLEEKLADEVQQEMEPFGTQTMAVRPKPMETAAGQSDPPGAGLPSPEGSDMDHMEIE